MARSKRSSRPRGAEPREVRARNTQMTQDGVPGSQGTEFFGPYALTFLVCAVFVCGFAMRLNGITDPPIRFHPTRQFRSALIARAYYYATIENVSEERKRAATASKEAQGILEPPIMEWLASAAYWVSGGERLWLPRAMASLFWLLGGVFLFGTASRLVSASAGLIAAAFYMFLPYGIDASRSFQPDPLMVMLLLGGALAAVKYFGRPSPRHLALAVVVSAMAMFVKPVSLFLLYGAFVALAVSAYGLRAAIGRRDFWVYFAVSILPTVLYYVYGIFIARFLTGQARSSFMLYLLADPSYWSGWLDKVALVVGHPVLLLAVAGVVLASRGQQRAVLLGLWIGYVLYGLVFGYHIHTHDYYHLPLIPIVALSLGPLADLVLGQLSTLHGVRGSRAAAVGIIIVGLLLSFYQAPKRIPAAAASSLMEIAQSVGDAVGHSDKTVFLAREYGKPLQYYGEIAGVNWPDTTQQQANALRGRPKLDARERLEEILERHEVEFFIITNLRDFARQKDLRDLLGNEFPVHSRDDRFIIFDLRSTGGTE